MIETILATIKKRSSEVRSAAKTAKMALLSISQKIITSRDKGSDQNIQSTNHESGATDFSRPFYHKVLK